MSKPYKKTAKDLAFDRERAKLNAIIQNKKTRFLNSQDLLMEPIWKLRV